jgi:hypothetical protein
MSSRRADTPCCSYKRCKSDALLDDSDGKLYCGTCWQRWVTAKRNLNSITPSSTQLSHPVNSQSTEKLYEDNGDIGELEGFVTSNASGNDRLYLLARKCGLVFDCSRTQDGFLRRVGVADTSGIVKWDIETSELGSPGLPNYPFDVNPADHCETPLAAYRDISNVLEFLATSLGKTRESLIIYDPYYCNGAVKRHLSTLGFKTVLNQCDDFYEVVKNQAVPEYDCLITNPPYIASDDVDHVEALLKYVTTRRQRRPWFILQPNYVYVKPYWKTLTSCIYPGPLPFFLTPPQPRDYVYETPPGLRQVRSSARKTAPFVTFWYVWLGDRVTASFYEWWATLGFSICPRLRLDCSEYFLPDNFKDSSDKTRRKRKGKKRRRDPE